MCYNVYTMNFIYDYKLIWIPLLVMSIAQLMKFGRYVIRHGFDFEYMLTPGHFPSAHSAFVTSLLICIGYYEKTTSSDFALAFAFALITIYDALRIRVNIGIQGRVLNRLLSQLDDLKEVDKKTFPHLKERVGHYKNEVLGGIIVSFIISYILIYLVEFLK